MAGREEIRGHHMIWWGRSNGAKSVSAVTYMDIRANLSSALARKNRFLILFGLFLLTIFMLWVKRMPKAPNFGTGYFWGPVDLPPLCLGNLGLYDSMLLRGHGPVQCGSEALRGHPLRARLRTGQQQRVPGESIDGL